MSLRDRIIAVDDLQREIVKIEQWGFDVEIRGMSGAARAAIVQDAADNNGNINFAKMMPEVVIGCVFDPLTGEQVFGSEDKENLFYILIYDKETDLIVGSIDEVYFGETWESELKYSILTCEDKLEKSQCPKCTFWLIQKTNKYGHHFLSCSDYPECNYSCEID